MRKIFLLWAASLSVLTACKDDGGDKLDDYAYIYINGKDGGNKALVTRNEDGRQMRRTVEEICKGDSLCLVGVTFNWKGETVQMSLLKHISDGGIDTANNRITMLAGNIGVLEKNEFLDSEWKWYILKTRTKPAIDSEGKPYFLETLEDADTVAYVPTAQRLAVVERLTELFKDKSRNWSEIYAIFNGAFTFIPCTGEEYRKLQEEGLD